MISQTRADHHGHHHHHNDNDDDDDDDHDDHDDRNNHNDYVAAAEELRNVTQKTYFEKNKAKNTGDQMLTNYQTP